MPYSTDSPPQAARKYKPKCQRAFVHAFNSVHDRTKDEGKAMAAGHAAAQRCEGKRSSMSDVKFNIFSGTLKSLDSGDGLKRLRTTASSTIRDLSGDTMTLKALQGMAESAEGMTIFLNHKYQVPEDVLGSVEKAHINQKGADIWDLDFDVRVEDSNPRAVKTHEAITNGSRLGTSIGALIPEGGAERTDDGLLINSVILLEASIVGIPANPRSFVHYAVKAYTEAEADLEDGVEPPFEGAAWDPKAKVWVTVDTEDTAEADAESASKPSGGSKSKPKTTPSKAKKEEEPVLTETITDEATIDNTVKLTDAEGHLETEAPEEAPEEAPADSPSDEEEEAEATKEAAAEQPDSSDVPATQEAPESAPESDGNGDESASEVLGKSFDALYAALEIRNDELVEARKALAGETEKRASAERELREAKDGLKLAQHIVERIAALPIGKRAGFTDEVSDFRTKFGELYDPEFLKLLEK